MSRTRGDAHVGSGHEDDSQGIEGIARGEGRGGSRVHVDGRDAVHVGSRSIKKLAMLVWVICVHAAALALFTTGFFLTRFEVSDISSCNILPHADVPEPAHLRRHADDSTIQNATHHADDDAHGCWMPRRYKRVVFVVIDALRYDFVANASTDNPTDASSSSAAFYHGHLPIFRDVLTRKPQHALLLKFVADPPTMTMQRLKGLTTGSLPTFLDIKDNMASAAIVEDNLILQMRSQHRPVVFMGDDTWDALYAQHFTRAYAFESFNVKDLDSVDRGVTRHLFPELAQRDWGLLIAHFLGVDHVGHTHGPSSPFMTAKLDELNSILKRLVDALDAEADDSDTLLVVLGDHGMSADGNHGGATDDETDAALFLYSKQPLLGVQADDASDQWPTAVPQVDLVPTLALLSGLPIPFGNLGSVIPQLFMDDANNNATLNRALALNVDQVRRYLQRYSRASKLPAHALDALDVLFERIAALRKQIQATTETADAKAIAAQLTTQQQLFLRNALALGRSVWTQFDLVNMSWGIVFLLWSLVFVVLQCVRTHASDRVPLWSSAAGALIGAVVPALDKLVPVLPAATASRALVLAVLCGLVDASVRVWWTTTLPSAKQLCAAVKANATVLTVAAAAVVLLHTLALLSNSYIVAEARVTTFLAVTAGAALLFASQRQRDRVRRASAVHSSLFLVVFTRIASALAPPHIIQSDVSLFRTWLPLVATVALACLSTIMYTGVLPRGVQPSSVRSLCVNTTWRERSAFLSVVVSCASCSVFWLLSPSPSSIVRLWLPRLVLLIALSALVLQLVRPTAALVAQQPERLRLSPNQVLLVFQVAPAFMLVLGPTAPLSVLLLLLQAFAFAGTVAALRHSSDDRPTLVAYVLLWSAVSAQSFFVTGHDNTFTSLQNAAGFVGVDEFHFYIAGALLAFNTFGSYVLWVLCLPLLLATTLWPFVFALTHTDWRRAVFALVACCALDATVSTVFVALQRRHLMVWAIFAPKFIFAAATLLVLEVLLLLLSVCIAHSGARTIAERSATKQVVQ